MSKLLLMVPYRNLTNALESPKFFLLSLSTSTRETTIHACCITSVETLGSLKALRTLIILVVVDLLSLQYFTPEWAGSYSKTLLFTVLPRSSAWTS